MKKILLVLFILLISYGMTIAEEDTNPYIAGQPVASTPSYLVDETFETSEFDNVVCGSAPCRWASGTTDGDKSTAGLDMVGSYCFEADSGGSIYFLHTAQDQTTVYSLFKWRYVDAIDETEPLLITRNAADSANGGIYVYANGDIKAISFGGDFSAAAATSHAVDTSLWIRFKSTEGTGANATNCVSTWNGTSWDPYVCNAEGSGTGDLVKWEYTNNQDGTGTELQYIDNVKISLSDFTADPSTY